MLAPRVSEVRAEVLLTELLAAQGWDTRRPPKGDMLRQHEYKDHSHLRDAFHKRSKVAKTGHGLPEAVLVDRSLQPLLVVEAKASADDIDKAVEEATLVYGNACVDAGFSPLAVALAGTSDDDFAVRVSKWDGREWRTVTYEGNPIGWIPNRKDVDRLRTPSAAPEMRPSIPGPEILAARADEINRLLRESSVNDRARPSVVGACMLALWQSRGALRKDPANVLADINRACEQAFWKAGKADLAKSLHVDEANGRLAVKARRVLGILERLNVSVLTAEHDYLGQLYETFFRYAGGNTIGQYFTPRHVADFCADLAGVTAEDVTLDPTCGTGGFLIAAMERMQRVGRISRSEMVGMVGTRLVGFDDEPVTAALCVANMILRGDGSSSVHRGNAFNAPEYPDASASVVLMNPPYPHKKTDEPTDAFVERGLDGLAQGGRLVAIIPQSRLVRGGSVGKWRSSLLARHTLEAVIQMPDYLFQPYASATTAIIHLRKGIPHPRNKRVFFARVENDGYRLKKNVRIPCEGNQLRDALDHFLGSRGEEGFSGWSLIDDETSFAPGAYIPARETGDAEIDAGIRQVIRCRTAFVALHASELADANTDGAVDPLETKQAADIRPAGGGTVGDFFSIVYGQKSLHSKEGLMPGNSLVISSSGTDNGCYGFYDFDDLLKPPFVTVPGTGSIAVAHVQEWPCGATDDCLLLVPKAGVPRAMLYIAAAAIRNERWRFSYGRKATPARIANFPLPRSGDLIERVNAYLDRALRVEQQMLADARLARRETSEMDGPG